MYIYVCIYIYEYVYMINDLQTYAQDTSSTKPGK